MDTATFIILVTTFLSGAWYVKYKCLNFDQEEARIHRAALEEELVIRLELHEDGLVLNDRTDY